ncbi:uncharacterized protein SEPMUDRAFT_121563 [Sphaerulina musiva SO2202]|uniref:Uncharacterized protein n=1 Tax=Sphaerulina musiva (strain SO2202) TaxID=692275 RepID=M3CV81_SPHMS|nr:uncharacterized protein SEPMUDRAFT_121563 [Sphaerulina musiva SO2202]EMF08057.1 hypothetical protein SEPMUDRAFT_121563 [Sphaerulina musiva SO2202]
MPLFTPFPIPFPNPVPFFGGLPNTEELVEEEEELHEHEHEHNVNNKQAVPTPPLLFFP